ncbi:MAG: flagellar basal-body rod protein FlgG [Fimbriimonas ginsengisoli]|uniref:Flagellar basal-body rod protein FlgG n=1 Tax=Fimbriimonas ginsengisoli TaxID=1005039 RepID=A0A931LYX2_FIMGI|nr:flagellar basal-body rod protein FlgG [Fimbriimonas ginsengisoli]
MIRTLTTAGAGMIAQQTNLDTIANNLANVNTVGFKSLRAEFQDMVYQTLRGSGAASGASSSTPTALQVGLGSRFSATSVTAGVGPMQTTGNPLDVAIQGEGFFQVQRADGTLAYTRDGSLKRDATGLLVTSDGFHVIPEVTIPSGATAVSIAPTGVVTAVLPGQSEPQQLGQITIATFSNPAGLTRMGQNLFQAGGGSGDAKVGNPGDNGSGTLQSGFLEGSNVQVVEEMVRMITAQRAYEINSKAIQTADEMLSTINNLKR